MDYKQELEDLLDEIQLLNDGCATEFEMCAGVMKLHKEVTKKIARENPVFKEFPNVKIPKPLLANGWMDNSYHNDELPHVTFRVQGYLDSPKESFVDIDVYFNPSELCYQVFARFNGGDEGEWYDTTRSEQQLEHDLIDAMTKYHII